MATTTTLRIDDKVFKPKVKATVGFQMQFGEALERSDFKVYRTPRKGGAGALAGHSAALFWMTLHTFNERCRMVDEFEDELHAWIGRCMKEMPRFKKRSEWRTFLKDARTIRIYPWVYREVDRVGIGGIERFGQISAATGLWYFGWLPASEQQPIIQHVQQQHAERHQIDKQAAEALRMIGGGL